MWRGGDEEGFEDEEEVMIWMRIREPFKNVLGFCPLRGGGVPPLSAKLF